MTKQSAIMAVAANTTGKMATGNIGIGNDGNIHHDRQYRAISKTDTMFDELFDTI